MKSGKILNYSAIDNFDLPYCSYLDTSEPRMTIDGDIGGENGIDCALFAKTLRLLDQLSVTRGYTRICIDINTGGGEVETGMSIYTEMLSIKTPVDTYVTGRANSMGGVLFQSGRKRFMYKHTSLMLHDPSGSDNVKQLKIAKDSLVTMLTRHGLSEKKISDLMSEETWIMAEDAKKKGLCDEVIDISKLNNVDKKVLWNQLQIVTNKITENMNKETLALALGLSKDASDKEINDAAAKIGCKVVNYTLNAIPKAKAEDDEDEEEEEKPKKKKKSVKDEEGESALDKMCGLLDAMKEEMKNSNKALADKIAAMEEADKKKAKNEQTNKIQNKITSLVKAGKIADDVATIAQVAKDFEDNFSMAERVYDATPSKITVAAAKVTDLLSNAEAKASAEKIKALVDEVVKTDGTTNANAGTITYDKDGNNAAFTPTTPTGAKRVSMTDAKKELTAAKA